MKGSRKEEKEESKYARKGLTRLQQFMFFFIYFKNIFLIIRISLKLAKF